MYICNKCKSETNDEDRYCHNCGSYIGEPLIVEVDEQSYVENSENDTDEIEVIESIIVEKKKNKFDIYFEGLIEIYKNMLLKPKETIEEAPALIDKKTSFTITFIFVIISSILYMLLQKSKFAASFDIAFQDYNAVSFLLLVLMSLFGVISLFCCVYILGHFIFKGETELFTLWNTLLFSFVPFMSGITLFILIYEISFYAGIVIVMLSLAASLIIIPSGLMKNMNLTKAGSILTALLGCIFMATESCLYITVFIK